MITKHACACCSRPQRGRTGTHGVASAKGTHGDARGCKRKRDVHNKRNGQHEAKGANVDVANSSGVTALMVACRYGREACARALLDKGANVDVANSDGFTALMAACQNGHEACARALLDKGAEVDVADSDGDTALMLAWWSGHVECARALFDKGAKVNVSTAR